MRLVKMVVAVVVIVITWLVVALYEMLLKASGEDEATRVGPTTGRWPYRWLW